MKGYNTYRDVRDVIELTNPPTFGFFAGLSFLFSGVNRITGPITRNGPRLYRNGPCWCGRGKKWKNCCGKNE